MARVITDYGYVVYIADVIVMPEYQGKGVGRLLLNGIMKYINDNIAPGQQKSINLMAAKGKEEFYKKFGFEERPNDYSGCGMSQWISK
jgi:GNAT superfamily N-acetyltransferase